MATLATDLRVRPADPRAVAARNEAARIEGSPLARSPWTPFVLPTLLLAAWQAASLTGALIERVWLRQGFTALLVTHDVTEAVALGDRVVVMEGGRITRDIAVVADRPRWHGDAALAAVEGKILARLLEG